jgi:membrane protein
LFGSIILYFGAEFTKAYALQKGVHIVPTEYAVWDEKPAIAGAKSPSETVRKPQAGIQPKYALSTSRHSKTDDRKEEKKKDKRPGFGMMAAGLLLYFLKSTRDNDKVHHT